MLLDFLSDLEGKGEETHFFLCCVGMLEVRVGTVIQG